MLMTPIDLHDIVTESFQQEIQDSFAYATGFGVVFLDRAGKHIGPGSNFTKFCRCINARKDGAHCCTLSNQHAISLALKSKKPSIYVCHANLINIEIPLIYKNYYVGAITAGQVLCPEMDFYPKDAISASVNWLDDPQLAEYYKEIPVLSRQQIEAATTALMNLSNFIIQSFAYNQVVKDYADNREKLLLSEKRQLNLEHQLKLAQLDALQKQVTPHFMFNVLSSVSRLLSLGEYDTASKMVDSFAHMMRYSLSDIHTGVTLEQEMAYIKNYLSIQKYRFGDLIHYRISCDEKAKKVQIPFFALQPLVENSVEHGILAKAEGGTITVHVTCTAASVLIDISDNGVGIPKESLEMIQKQLVKDNLPDASHVGLYNCYRRFMLLYKDNADFQITSKESQGTQIKIRIPH